jgi:N-acetylglucosaminyldiphosphoundecaprenol N-acetyl-beta-D-mannosaminyltransferase
MKSSLSKYNLYISQLSDLGNGKTLINTINAHSHNLTFRDSYFQEALINSDVLIPDGISIVYATRWLNGKKIKKIAGADLFFYELDRLEKMHGKCFFLGSSVMTLEKIKERISKEFPNIEVQTFSPPFKKEFNAEENSIMLKAINAFKPDALMVGMTAPKQEKWAYKHYNQLEVGHICCIGAVFDFYAGTVKRAPKWMIKLGMEWFYRLIKEPGRMWQRYLIGNMIFIGHIIREKLKL